MGDVNTPPLGVNEGSGNKNIPIDSFGTKRPTERIMPLRETLSDLTRNAKFAQTLDIGTKLYSKQ